MGILGDARKRLEEDGYNSGLYDWNGYEEPTSDWVYEPSASVVDAEVDAEIAMMNSCATNGGTWDAANGVCIMPQDDNEPHPFYALEPGNGLPFDRTIEENEIGAEFYDLEGALEQGFWNRAFELGATPQDIEDAGGPGQSFIGKVAGNLPGLLGVAADALGAEDWLYGNTINRNHNKQVAGDVNYQSMLKRRQQQTAADQGMTLPAYAETVHAGTAPVSNNDKQDKKAFKKFHKAHMERVRNETPSYSDGKSLNDVVKEHKDRNPGTAADRGWTDTGAFYETGGIVDGYYANGGDIHIKKANEGKFTAYAKSKGMTVPAAADMVMAAPEGKYSPSIRKMANFAKNARGFSHKADGGITTAGYHKMPDGQMMADKGMSDGGNVEYDGGFPGEPRGTDKTPVWLSRGEFIVNRASAQQFAPQLEAMNNWEPNPNSQLGMQKARDNKINGR